MSVELVPFTTAVEDASRGNPKLPQSSYREAGRFPIVDQGRRPVAGYTDDEADLCQVRSPVIVFGDHTRAFKYVDFPFAIGADGVKVLRVREGWDPKYVFHYLSSRQIPSAGYSRHFKFLKDLEVPQPSLDEQRRVAAILDHADILRAKRRQTLAHLDILTQSVFLEMFGDPMSNSRGLPLASIGSIAQVMTGNSPSRADARNFGTVIEWIKSDNLGDDVATEAEEWLSESGQARARIAPAGSVLVTCIAGSPQSIGKASLVDRDVAFNQQINAVLPSSDIETSFLLRQLKVAPALVRLKSTGGMKGLVNKSSFQSIQVLLPSLEEQREFVARGDRIRSQIDTSRRALAADEELFASLQFRAFRGEL